MMNPAISVMVELEMCQLLLIPQDSDHVMTWVMKKKKRKRKKQR